MTMTRLEAVLAMIGEKTDAANAQLDKAEEYGARTTGLRVVGESPDRLATVTVDEVGQMVDLDFGDRFATASAEELRTAILAAQTQAKQRLTNRIREIGEEVYGPDSAAVAVVADSYESRYGSFDEEDEQR